MNPIKIPKILVRKGLIAFTAVFDAIDKGLSVMDMEPRVLRVEVPELNAFIHSLIDTVEHGKKLGYSDQMGEEILKSLSPFRDHQTFSREELIWFKGIIQELLSGLSGERKNMYM